jgi:hypothetical protein
MAQIVQKQIKDFDTLPEVPLDAFLVLQTALGTTYNTTKENLLTDTLSLSGGQLDGNLIINGDVTINGNSTAINVAELHIEDNIIKLNNGVEGLPSLDSGLEIERGTETNSTLLWNETNDRWEIGLVGDTSRILTSKDSNVTKFSLVNATNIVDELDVFSKYIGVGCKWLIVVEDGTNYRISELLSTWDSVNDVITFTETSTTDIGDTSDIMFAVDINGLSVSLMVSINNGTWNFKIQRTLL